MIESLQEYALVDPHSKTFEVYRRQENPANWLLTQGLTVPTDVLFENV